jgi:fatty-acyl-CoA synthase
MFLERFRSNGLRASALTTCYAMAENVFAVSQGGISEPVTIDRISQHCLLSDRKAVPAVSTEDALNMLSAGKPLENTSIKIVNQNKEKVGERILGEIAILSDCMLTGYYNRPDLSEQAFDDGWYLTGDLGYLADGEVYITGRKKDLIIVGGKNIYPQDLESLASEIEGVHPGRVAAFGIPNEISGTEEVVIVAEVDLAIPNKDEYPWKNSSDYNRIADEIRMRVTRGSDIALRRVELVSRGWLIKTSSGKIARNANRDKYLTEITVG